MEKQVLEEILNNKRLPKIKEKIERISQIKDLVLTTRDSNNKQYGEIPTIQFKIKSEKQDNEAKKFYLDSLKYLRQNMFLREENLMVIYSNLDTLNNHENNRNVDIYIKNLKPVQQIEFFDKLAEVFNRYLDKITNHI